MREGEQYDLDEAMQEVRAAFSQLRVAADAFTAAFASELENIERQSQGMLRTATPNAIEEGPLSVDVPDSRCFWRGETVHMTQLELKMIATMAKRPDMTYSRDFFLDSFLPDAYDRTIDSHIKRIRNKFKKIDPDFDRIYTVWGVGYRWNP